LEEYLTMTDNNALSESAKFWHGRRVLVTGAQGFIGQNLVAVLRHTGCDLILPTRSDYDLLEQDQVRGLFRDSRPDLVFHLAGLVGGIMANTERPAEFCYQNLLMAPMMMHEAWQAKVKKYVTLIGGCSYPAHASSPIGEGELWKGYPQAESAPYSLAKSMNVLQAQAYRRQYNFNAVVLIPGNVYGPHDNFDLGSSHVIPALIRKFYEAKRNGQEECVAWGSGRPVRDFIYVQDACEAIALAARIYDDGDIINLSSGVPTSIKELVDNVAELVGYRGKIRWDTSKPDGQMCKVFDVARMRQRLGFSPSTSLRDGLRRTIDWFASSVS
jgi:GDP-L-fucose synthase